METDTAATISAKIQQKSGNKNKKEPPKFLVCDNPLYGDEVFVRKLNSNSFTVRMHDMTVIEGKASPEELTEVQNFYCTYQQFLNQ